MIFLKCSYHPNLIELQNAPLTYSLWWDGKVLKNPTYYVDFFQHNGTFVALDLASSEGNFYIPSFSSDYFENIDDRIDKHKD